MIGVESPRAACGDRSVAGPSASVVGAMASRGDTPSPADLIAFVRRIARQPARRLTTEEKRLAAVIRTVRDERVRSTETMSGRKRRTEKPVPEQPASGRKRRTTSRVSPVPQTLPSGPVQPRGAALSALPQRQRIDMLLQSVSAMYHQTSRHGIPAGMERFIPPSHDRLQYSTIEALLSPLRKRSIWESWSPIQLAIFESGLCTLGKDFHAIAKLIENKTTRDVVNLYYHWKQSAHYHMWKALGKPTARPDRDGTDPQRAMQVISELMKSSGRPPQSSQLLLQ
ncbi:hypothetical protein PBRA_001536 [Plasmodiophora brassicae]|uniref:SANT domain-containing protein n=1 Tax=Plasmodiophora brassicae TaxID=37360 RepID=A0A0G4IYZ0_PLABS|nr:hypothetical protein PBRA_001536 [Plasmodiophora brassicae]